MSGREAGAGLRLLRQRQAAIPEALRQLAAAPDPVLGPRGGAGCVATGIGSSEAHARFLAHLVSGPGAGRARFAGAGEFLAEPGPAAREETLVVFSQGLSPNARFALARPEAWGRVVLVTATPPDGGTRHDAAAKRALLSRLEDAGAFVYRIPGADEYGTLLRLLGPMVGYLAALRLTRVLTGSAPAFDVDAVAAAIAAAPGHLAATPPAADEEMVFLAAGVAAELAGNLRLKVLEGLRRPAPPAWDLLHLAHGPWQELHGRRALLLALTHRSVDTDAHALRETSALLVPGRHRLLSLCATLPPPLGLFEHEALVNELVLRGIENEGLDPGRWPGDTGESGLYHLAPPTPTRGAPPRAPVPSRVAESRAPARLAGAPHQGRLAALTWPEVDAQLAAGRRTVVIPLGALEQHGPHLPLDTDARIADALAERFCAAVPEALRLPALWTGCSREHLAFAGTIDLRPETLLAVLVDVVDSLARHGFERLFVFSAHGGNDRALRTMEPTLRATAAPARVLAVTGLGEIAASQAQASAVHGIEAAACGHHAGEHETSILLGLDPAAVRTDRLEAGRLALPPDPQTLFHPSLRKNAANGVVGDPRQAEGVRAEAYLAAWTALLVDAYRLEKNAT